MIQKEGHARQKSCRNAIQSGSIHYFTMGLRDIAYLISCLLVLRALLTSHQYKSRDLIAKACNCLSISTEVYPNSDLLLRISALGQNRAQPKPRYLNKSYKNVCCALNLSQPNRVRKKDMLCNNASNIITVRQILKT